MKKPKIKIILFLTILCVTAGFTLSACNVVNTYKVTFLSDGEVYATVEIKGGETIALPADPIKEGYTFDGWVYLNNPSINFDVSGKIIASIIVSAKWILDENGGTDLNGGVYAIYNVEKNSDGDEVTDAAVADTVNRLRGVLFNRGYTKATVVEQSSLGGTRQIRVEVPDVEDPQSLFDLLGRPALLEFKDPDNLETVYVTGQNVTEAYAGYSGTDPVVVLKFDADGTTAFRDATTAKVGSSIGIYVNGTLIAKLTVNEAIITGEATITGVEDYAACQELALQIQGGSFPVKLVSVECGLL